jgi:hypothetical protein
VLFQGKMPHPLSFETFLVQEAARSRGRQKIRAQQRVNHRLRYWKGRHRPTKDERAERRRLSQRGKSASREAAKNHRYPTWADRKAIRAIYEGCPPGHHVDHVVPLRGSNVSGLHVAGNLQYLPAEENLAKGNAF